MKQKSLNEIVQNIINNIHDTLPDVDTKEGTFIRDVFINPQADMFASLYSDIKKIELSQSILTATGEDLDNLASNYFVYRKSATNSFGKVRFYINNTNIINNEENIPDEIIIPYGTIVSTAESLTSDSIKFIITEGSHLNKQQILNLPSDSSNGNYKYIELSARSVEVGSKNNISYGEIINQETNQISDIFMVINPFPFSGGTDQEDDMSLSIRIGLAISGANIGTKDGYLSFTLKQNGVVDATVIGAGDPIMERDGGYTNENGIYVPGNGGKVDIYVRGNVLEQVQQTYIVNHEFLNTNNEIKLNIQPVQKITSISTDDGFIFSNADDYSVTQETTKQENGKDEVNPTYYKDVEWDFNLTDSFPIIDGFELPDNLPSYQVKELKNKLDQNLKDILNNGIVRVNESNNQIIKYKLINISPETKWNNIKKSLFVTELFEVWGLDDEIYKLTCTHDWLDGAIFIKKNDRINLRIRVEPDYKLVKDTNKYYEQSNRANDKILWLKDAKNKPFEGQRLNIEYNFDKLINDVQSGIEKVRIMTDDVLIKKAKAIPIEINLDVQILSIYNISEIKSNIINEITKFINNIKKIGGRFDESDIIALVKNIDGVDLVDLGTVSIKKIGYDPEKIIEAKQNEYFELGLLNLNVRSFNNI